MPLQVFDKNGNPQAPAQHGGTQHRPPQGHPQGHPQGQQAVPPAPPRNMIPVDLHGGPAIKISDISQDFKSQSDMESELTDYKVFRLEKMLDKDALDDYGQPKWPSWEKVIRTEDRSISNRVAANKIRQLNSTTKGIIDKKNTLTPALKRQIDSTLEDLMKQEPDPVHFCWSLEQIDHQLRRIEPYYPVALNPHRISVPSGKHRNTNSFLFPSNKRPHSGNSSHKSKKKKKTYERISLTAYFKRAPRQSVDIIQLWRARKAMAGMYQTQPGVVHNVFPQVQANQAQFQGQQQPHRQQPGPPPNRPPPGSHPNQNAHQHTGGQGRGHNPRAMRHSGSDSDSDDSRYSRGSSSGGSRGRTHTPPSSVSDRGHRQAKDRHTQHRPNGPANQHRPHTPRNDQHRRDHHRRGGSPPFPHISLPPRRPPYPVSQDSGSVASHIERIRQDAYRRGQVDARLEELVFTKAHDRGRPHIVQERSSLHPRRMYRGPDDLDMPRYLSGLSLGDDDYDDEYEDDEYRREFERRKQQGSILEDDPFDLNPPSPSSYTYSTDAGLGRGRRRVPQIIEIPQSPRLRRRPPYPP
ncbi:hypothetical protein F5B22DRAFT_8667 [Xylaria bambusicola]|uniref:uncharacterized protein n=1 Tax=Xylaria bambusicola TaxID=326684 RepID=UPI002007F013|nr:uncharacterized protein F5B22DRAFT_8667 [Xylaria bambusicola]KAI0527877.1 hypothetical protein F5B22DRAFT_8667 [Xylaria bambusicola]